MNLVLADTEEFRRTRRRGKAAPGATQQVTETEERRAIGLTIIRGAHVISLSVDGPPPADPAARLGATSGGPTTAATLAAGPGVARPAGRGLPVGLTGPTPGVGGPGPGFGGGFPGAPGFGGPPGFGGRGGPPGGGPRVFSLSSSKVSFTDMS
jgi:small nuclear ribonucleoprotein B and B'